MSDINLREAKSVTGVPDEDGSVLYYGVDYTRGSVTPTRITVTQDLPGLHCNMDRVRVYAGDDLIWEGPLHSLEGVEYFTLVELAAREQQRTDDA